MRTHKLQQKIQNAPSVGPYRSHILLQAEVLKLISQPAEAVDTPQIFGIKMNASELS